MEEGGNVKYTRPSSAAATSHVLIGGNDSDLLRLQPLLKQLGAIHITNPERFRCFASFSSPAEATVALTAISTPAAGHADLNTLGKVVARYADVRVMKKSSPSSMPIVTPAVLSAEECGIPGLQLLPEYVSEEEERSLLLALDARPWKQLARRRVQHYGTTFSYLTRSVDAEQPTKDFPQEVNPLLIKICSIPGVGPLDQLTVNEYSLGVGLSPHIDTHSAFGSTIASLSLAGPTAMVFRNRHKNEQHALIIPPRSLLIMSGASRFAWEHYIPHRKSDPVASRTVPLPRADRRVSLTFRLVRKEPCACDFPEDCDDQDGCIPPTRMGQAAMALEPCRAQKLENEKVRDVYDAIAGHFSATRFAIWPKVREFIEKMPSGAVVADVGCGNGKYFGVRRDIFVAGSDLSTGLAEVAARRLCPPGLPTTENLLADVAVVDALHLPYRPFCFDGILCIAVLHHISTVKRRLQLLEELARVLLPSGRAIVTVWATEQENMKKIEKWKQIEGELDEDEEDCPGMDYLVPWHLPLHRAEASAAVGAGAGADVDSEKNTLVFQRYYHLFAPGELEGLVERVPGVSLVESFYDRDNWCAVLQKGPTDSSID